MHSVENPRYYNILTHHTFWKIVNPGALANQLLAKKLFGRNSCIPKRAVKWAQFLFTLAIVPKSRPAYNEVRK